MDFTNLKDQFQNNDSIARLIEMYGETRKFRPQFIFGYVTPPGLELVVTEKLF